MSELINSQFFYYFIVGEEGIIELPINQFSHPKINQGRKLIEQEFAQSLPSQLSKLMNVKIIFIKSGEDWDDHLVYLFNEKGEEISHSSSGEIFDNPLSSPEDNLPLLKKWAEKK